MSTKTKQRFTFPALAITRLLSPEVTTVGADAPYQCNEPYALTRIDDMLADLPKRIFDYHYDEADKHYANSVFTNWTLLHRQLAVLHIKPRAIERIVAQYNELLVQGQDDTTTVSIEATDFLNDAFLYSPYYLTIQFTLLNRLPKSIRLAVFKLMSPSLLTPQYNWEKLQVLTAVSHGVHDLLKDLPSAGFAIAVDLLPLFYDWRANVLSPYPYLDSYHCVPYVISAMNTKKQRKMAQAFLQNSPETFFNEMAYILFTKPANDTYKRARNHAKKLLQDMIDNDNAQTNYIAQLKAAVQRFANDTDNSANKKSGHKMVTFLEDYLQHYAEQQRDKALAEQTTTTQNEWVVRTNSDGIPLILSNSDWQKATGKRKFVLDDKILPEGSTVRGLPVYILTDECGQWTHEVCYDTLDNYRAELAKDKDMAKLIANHNDNDIFANTTHYIPILDALTPPTLIANGNPLPNAEFEQLLLMLKYSTLDNPIAGLTCFLTLFTKESLNEVAKQLWQSYAMAIEIYRSLSELMLNFGDVYAGAKQMIKNSKWYITASAWLADESLADSVWHFTKSYASAAGRRPITLHSIDVLTTQACLHPDSLYSKNALNILARLSLKARSGVRQHADAALAQYANTVGLTLDELTTRLIPDFELDAQGSKRIAYQPETKPTADESNARVLTVFITPELKFAYRDNTGKTYKNPPKAKQTEDGEVVQTFLSAHKQEKKQLRELATDLPKRLEALLLSQKPIPMTDFIDYYAQHPVTSQLVQRLLWQVQLTDGSSDKQTFRVSASHELLDSDENPLTPHWRQDKAMVRLAHPINLNQEDIAKWSQLFSDYELIQPFPQLDRPVYLLTEDEKATGVVNRFDEQRFAMGSLHGLAKTDKGWLGFEQNVGTNGYRKHINGQDVEFTVLDYFYHWQQVQANDPGRRLNPITLPDTPDAMAVSELLYTIDGLARVS